MRCDTIQQELSTPGGLDRAVVAQHMDVCPSCASWAIKVENLDRIWEASRPAEPSAEAFEAMWARVVAQSSAPAVLEFTARPQWKKWGLRLAAMGQAAALLIAASVLLSSRPSPAVAAMNSYTVEGGKTLFVTLRDGQDPSVVEAPEQSGSETDMVSVDFDILGYMESIR